MTVSAGVVHLQVEPIGTPRGACHTYCDSLIEDPPRQLAVDLLFVTCPGCQSEVQAQRRLLMLSLAGCYSTQLSRLTVDRLCAAYRALPGNGDGGPLRLLLEGGHWQKEQVEHCRKLAVGIGDALGERLAGLLRGLPDDRRRAWFGDGFVSYLCGGVTRVDLDTSTGARSALAVAEYERGIVEDARARACAEVEQLKAQLARARKSIEFFSSWWSVLGEIELLPPDLARIYDLEGALRGLIGRVRKVGGYASPEEQEALWRAERALASGLRWVAGGSQGLTLELAEDPVGGHCSQALSRWADDGGRSP